MVFYFIVYQTFYYNSFIIIYRRPDNIPYELNTTATTVHIKYYLVWPTEHGGELCIKYMA